VIDDIEPVADVLAVAVNRKLPAVESVGDNQGNELFGKMVGSIVVGAIGDQGGQGIGVMVSADQVIRGGLAGRIGRAGVEGRLFCEKPRFPQGPVDLVGADMEKA
jgi:hypothetical protein